MSNKLVYCTIFNKSYISRGIVLYESLERCCNNFLLYIIAFDKETENYLLAKNYNNLIVVPYEEFEDDRLREAKSNRTAKEYFWTCGCYSIKYVLEHYNVNHCTYIDADMYFYNNPISIYNEFLESKCSVGIISHRYPNYMEYKYIASKNGKYCVEYNTFKNDEEGLKVLNWWCDSCLECCSEHSDGIHFGDQKYIEEFSKISNSIYEYNDPGCGVAPWNISDYKYSDNKLMYKKSNEKVKLYFYHFHGMNIVNENSAEMKVLVRPGKHDFKLLKKLYIPYAKKIISEEELVKNEIDFGLQNNNISLKNMWMSFLFGESNIILAIRKIYRYVLFYRKDRLLF